MNILIIGNGGREHALAWKVAQSSLADKVFVAPGNAGTALETKIENVPISPTNIPKLLVFAQSHNIDLTIVGSEESLVLGVVDMFQTLGLKIFGPSKAATQLESSKSFAKDFLRRHNIPSATYQSFTKVEPALNYVRSKDGPIVIKANGLAGGKGVIIAMTLPEAENAVQNMLINNVYGNAGHQIVIEDFLIGEEISFIVMVDGAHVVPLATSQDHQRVGNGDSGLNTGGMGACSPALVVTKEIHQYIMEQIIWPTIRAMAEEGHIYVGFLYAELMISDNNKIKVIEFNCRSGDPETQTIMLRLRSDFLELCLAGVEGKLDKQSLDWDERSALGVVLASDGYPGYYNTGEVIYGLSKKDFTYGKVFHSGTCMYGDKLVTSGGRVLCVTALGATIRQAQKRAYYMAEGIQWKSRFYRQDIGYRAIMRSKYINNGDIYL